MRAAVFVVAVGLSTLAAAADVPGVQPPAEPANAGKSAQGVIAAISGRVEVRRAEMNAWQAAKIGEELFIDDWVRTGELSRARIRFHDGSSVNLDSSSQFHVIRAGSGTSMEIQRGRAWSSGRDKTPTSEALKP